MTKNKLKLIGIEGGYFKDEPLPSITWGACAISDDEYLINPVTGRKSNLSELAHYREEGGIIFLEKPIKINQQYDFALIVNYKHETIKRIFSNFGQHVSEDVICFGSLDIFNSCAKYMTERLLEDLGKNFRSYNYKYQKNVFEIVQTLNAGLCKI